VFVFLKEKKQSVFYSIYIQIFSAGWLLLLPFRGIWIIVIKRQHNNNENNYTLIYRRFFILSPADDDYTAAS
jgi:hypothetical protein